MKLDKFSWDWFGSSRSVTITKDETTIIDGRGKPESIQARIEELQQQIEKNGDVTFQREWVIDPIYLNQFFAYWKVNKLTLMLISKNLMIMTC